MDERKGGKIERQTDTIHVGSLEAMSYQVESLKLLISMNRAHKSLWYCAVAVNVLWMNSKKTTFSFQGAIQWDKTWKSLTSDITGTARPASHYVQLCTFRVQYLSKDDWMRCRCRFNKKKNKERERERECNR